jgi:hypothetical protein
VILEKKEKFWAVQIGNGVFSTTVGIYVV